MINRCIVSILRSQDPGNTEKKRNNKNCSKRKHDNNIMASMCNSLGFFNITSQDLDDHNNYVGIVGDGTERRGVKKKKKNLGILSWMPKQLYYKHGKLTCIFSCD